MTNIFKRSWTVLGRQTTWQTQCNHQFALSRFNYHKHLRDMWVKIAVYSGPTGWHKCNGREVDVLHGTPNAPTPLLSRTAMPAVNWLDLERWWQKSLKNIEHSFTTAGVDITPFGIKISGIWGEQALILMKVRWRMVVVTKKPRSTTFLCQHLWVAVQLDVGTIELENNYNYIDIVK